MPMLNLADKREYQRNWMQRRRLALIIQLGGKCIICGTTKGLEFHHVDPEQKVTNISSVISRKHNITQEELAKCELRCKQHHADVHTALHGDTLWRRGCRCDICLEKRELLRKKDRENKRAKRAIDPFYGRSKIIK